jgi:phage terminase large subunit GpA-like protein
MKKNTVDMFTRIFKVLQPPPEMTLSQWADKFRRLSAGSSAEPGRWKTAKAPYQKEIMDAITDITIKKVVIMSAAQVGKTDAMVLNPIGYYVHYDPSPIMVIQPTIDMAEKFQKKSCHLCCVIRLYLRTVSTKRAATAVIQSCKRYFRAAL